MSLDEQHVAYNDLQCNERHQELCEESGTCTGHLHAVVRPTTWVHSKPRALRCAQNSVYFQALYLQQFGIKEKNNVSVLTWQPSRKKLLLFFQYCARKRKVVDATNCGKSDTFDIEQTDVWQEILDWKGFADFGNDAKIKTIEKSYRENLTKLAQQLSVVLAPREHTKTLRSFLSADKAIDSQWLREFSCSHCDLTTTCWVTSLH